MNLSDMQRTQPWTQPYAPAFMAMRTLLPHIELTHCLLHITKAVGILSSVAEWADHGVVKQDRVTQEEFENRTADLVMGAIRIANHPPRPYVNFDLETVVKTRTEAVNGEPFGYLNEPQPVPPKPYLADPEQTIADKHDLQTEIVDLNEAMNNALMAMQSFMNPIDLPPEEGVEPIPPTTKLDVMKKIEIAAASAKRLTRRLL